MGGRWGDGETGRVRVEAGGGSMWGPRQKLFVSASLGLWLLVVVWFASFCWFRGIRSIEDLWSYASMASLDDPVVMALARGEILPGSPIEDLLAIRQPAATRNYGRLVVHQYMPDLSFGDLQVQVVDGRVAAARAGGCTWDWDFFDEVPQDIRHAYGRVLLLQSTIRYTEEDPSELEKELLAWSAQLGMPAEVKNVEDVTLGD
jgi:hypothetical protein